MNNLIDLRRLGQGGSTPPFLPAGVSRLMNKRGIARGIVTLRSALFPRVFGTEQGLP